MKEGKFKQSILTVWYAWNERYQWFHVRKDYGLSIMDSEKTISYIKRNGVSIARYGDGEMDLMMQSRPEGYQELSDTLSEALKDVFRNHSPQLLICMPYPMVSAARFKKHGKKYWKGWALQRQKEVVTEVRKYIRDDYLFGDSFVSRPYSGYKSTAYSAKLFRLLKELWKDRDLLFVEGEDTRLGIGNDLFSNARSIRRILAPSKNAFGVYSQILESILANWTGELILLALGPTATVLASDLSKKGIQALDVGHIDIQYEWFLSGEAYIPVAQKYVNEIIGGDVVSACDDQEYLSQIIAEVK